MPGTEMHTRRGLDAALLLLCLLGLTFAVFGAIYVEDNQPRLAPSSAAEQQKANPTAGTTGPDLAEAAPEAVPATVAPPGDQAMVAASPPAAPALALSDGEAPQPAAADSVEATPPIAGPGPVAGVSASDVTPTTPSADTPQLAQAREISPSVSEDAPPPDTASAQEAPPAPVAPAHKPAVRTAPRPRYWVQFGVFHLQENALATLAELRNKSVQASVSERKSASGEALYFVRTSGLGTAAQAAQVAEAGAAALHSDDVLIGDGHNVARLHSTMAGR